MDEDNDLDVTEQGGQLDETKEKAQSFKEKGSEIKKFAKKKLKNTKNANLKKVLDFTTKIASKLGPLIPYILIAIIIIIIVVGFIAFIISMPGMITGRMKEFTQKMVDWYESLVTGKADAYVNKDDIIETANYLQSMGYDLVEYGFIPAKVVSSSYKDESQLMEHYTKDEETGIYKNSDGEAYSGQYIGIDGRIYEGSTGKPVGNAGEEQDKYGIIYSVPTTGEGESDDEYKEVENIETMDNEIVDFSSATDLSLLRTYLMSDIKTSIIRNFDKTNVSLLIINALSAFGQGMSGVPTQPIMFENDKWAYGIISLYNAIGGLATDIYNASEQGSIEISNNIMSVKGGWGSEPIKYSMDGWTGRYGLSLEFLLSLHMATMSPELVETIARTFNTDIQVYLDEMQDAKMIAYFRTDSGEYIVRDQIVGEGGDVISNADAFNIMKQYGIKSKKEGPFSCEFSEEPNLLYMNGSTTNNSYGKTLESSNSYKENVIKGKGDDGSEHADVASCDTWGDVESLTSTHVNKSELQDLINDIAKTMNDLKTKEEFSEYEVESEKTVTTISELENIIPFSQVKTEINSVMAKQCNIATFKHSTDGYNNGKIHVELLVYRTSLDNNWDFAVIAYQEISEAAKAGSSEDVCSDHFEDGTISKVCTKCEKYIESIREALKRTEDLDYKGKVPYIARVLEHWFRDVYFVIPKDQYANDDDSDNGTRVVDEESGETEKIKDDIAIKKAYSNDDNYGHGKLYGNEEGKMKLSGTDIQLVNVDDKYLEETGEFWSQYVMNENGTYKLYVLDSNGDFEKNISNVKPTEAKKFFEEDKDEDGNIIGISLKQDYTDEDVKEYDIKLVKKTVTSTSGKLTSTSDTLVWTAYNFGSTASQNKSPIEIESTTNEDIKKVSDKGDGTYEDRIYYSLSTSSTVAQAEDGQRGITNPIIKKMFKNRKYYMYDGTAERAEAIYEDWKSVLQEYSCTEEAMNAYIDDLYYSGKETTAKLPNGDPRNPDLIGNVDINTDSLNAFSILENIKTADAEYAYRDFKELIVELNYFDKEDLSDKIPEVFTWILPELKSTWPVRVIDKSENYYGTYIHSDEAIKTIKDKLGITEDEDGEVVVGGSEATESETTESEDSKTEEKISEEDAKILNSAKGYGYAGEVPEEDTETSEESTGEVGDSAGGIGDSTSDGEEEKEEKAVIGEVISPVTGEVIAYGTYERTNTDLVKYENFSEEEAKEEVGYIQIKVMDSEYFDSSWVEGDTEIGVGTEEATEKYTNAEALNLYYEEYKDVCEGYVVTIDGIKLLDGVSLDAKGNGLPSLISLSDNIKVTDTFEAKTTANLVDDDLEEANQQKENAKAAAPAVAKKDTAKGKKLYIREGAIIGYTTKTENENSDKDYSYMRVILRDDDSSERENVENYFELPFAMQDSFEAIQTDFPEEFIFWQGVLNEGMCEGEWITGEYYIADDHLKDYKRPDGSYGNTTAFGMTEHVTVDSIDQDIRSGRVLKSKAQEAYVKFLNSVRESILAKIDNPDNMSEGMLEAIMDLNHVAPVQANKLIEIYNQKGKLTEQDFRNYNGYSKSNPYYSAGVKRAELRINLAFNNVYEMPSHSGGGEIEFLVDNPWTTFCETDSREGIFKTNK